MKILISIAVLSLSTIGFGDYTPAGRMTLILKDDSIQTLIENKAKEDLELIVISDTGLRAKCPCWTYRLGFAKPFDNKNMKEIEIMLEGGFYDNDPYKITIVNPEN